MTLEQELDLSAYFSVPKVRTNLLTAELGIGISKQVTVKENREGCLW